MLNVIIKPTRIFILMGFLFSIISNAQSPGNIKGYEIWLKNEVNKSSGNISKANSKNKNDLNFNTAIHFSDTLKEKISRSLLKSRFTVFVVYKSNAEEHTVFTIKNKKASLDFTTKKIISSGKIEYTKGKPENGIIVGYLTSLEKKGKNVLQFMSEFLKETGSESEKKTSVMEFIYYPRFLNSLEKQKIETYLSLKYGVSLLGDKDYITAKGDTIWKFKSNTEYNQRITGIGRNDLEGLYQKQSGNSEKDGLYISVGDSLWTSNVDNKNVLRDQDFWLRGDNGKNTVLQLDKKQSDGAFKMDRIWKVQNIFSTDSLNTSIYLKKDEMTLLEKVGDTIVEKSMPYWLVVDNSEGNDFDYFNANYIKEYKSNSKNISFKDIVWKGSGSKKFTFIKAPNLFFDYEIITSCEGLVKGSVKLKITGGMAPYSLAIFKDGKCVKSITTSSKTLDIDNIVAGSYNLQVTDNAKGKFEKTLFVTSFETIQCQLNSRWYINSAPSVTIYPLVTSKNVLRYSWFYNGSLISEEKELKATQTGNYILIVKNDEDCEKEFLFTVEDKILNEGWVLYPNPTKRGEKFSIAFNYNLPTNISIKITDINGRVLKTSSLNEIKNATYAESLNVSGTYMVLITTGNTTETTKLIIE